MIDVLANGCSCEEHRKLQAAELQGIMIGMRYAQMALRDEYSGQLTDELVNKLRVEVTDPGYSPAPLLKLV